MKALREGVSTNKERLTMQWLSQSITEIRSEIAELQESSSNLSKNFQKKNLISEDIQSLRADLQNLRLELTAIKSRQGNTEVVVQELREEVIQSTEDLRRSLLRHNKVRTYQYLGLNSIISTYKKLRFPFAN